MTIKVRKPKERDVLTRLREESPDLRTKGLMDKLVLIVEHLWSNNAAYRQTRNRGELANLKSSLLKGTFSFSPMNRSYRPKPNKPGQTRPITKPHIADRLVLAALAALLDIILDNMFSPHSHGFRKRRGLPTFFKDMDNWDPMDLLIKADIVKCFDNIDHQLLLSALHDHLGEANRPFVNLISNFIKTKIWDDKKKEDCSHKTQGLPQGCSPSPVLANFFLNKLDNTIKEKLGKEGRSEYIRYADDLLIAIKRRVHSNREYRRFRQVFLQALRELKLKETAIKLIRGRPNKTRILGFVVSIRENGMLEKGAPLDRWKKKLTLEKIMAKMHNENKTLEEFLKAIEMAIKSRVKWAYDSTYQYSEKKMLTYFQTLIRKRVQEFSRTRAKKEKKLEMKIVFAVKKIEKFIKECAKKTREALQKSQPKKEGVGQKEEQSPGKIGDGVKARTQRSKPQEKRRGPTYGITEPQREAKLVWKSGSPANTTSIRAVGKGLSKLR